MSTVPLHGAGLEEIAKYSHLADATAKAEAKGLVVIHPEPDELFVDIDSEADMTWFHEATALLRGEHGLAFSVERLSPSPSGRPGRHHVVIKLAGSVEPEQRILLQLLFGSDRKRELLSWRDIRRGDPFPTIFFEKPEDAAIPMPSGGEGAP